MVCDNCNKKEDETHGIFYLQPHGNFTSDSLGEALGRWAPPGFSKTVLGKISMGLLGQIFHEFWPLSYCTVPYVLVLYCTLLFTVLYSAVLFFTVLCYTILLWRKIIQRLHSVLYCTVVYCFALSHTVLCFTLQLCTMLYCNSLCRYINFQLVYLPD